MMKRRALAKFMSFFSVKIYAKTAKKLFVAMPNSRLPMNFQLNIFIFEASVSKIVIEAKYKQE